MNGELRTICNTNVRIEHDHVKVFLWFCGQTDSKIIIKAD